MKKNIEIRYQNEQVQNDGNIVFGRAITFNSRSVDMGFTEIINSEAINQDLINRSDVFGLFNHDRNKVLARSRNGKGSLKLEIREDGLWYSFEIPNTELGNELRSHIERGEIYGSSFAFTVPADGSGEVITRDANNKVVRTITKIDGLYDVSPVFSPAYQDSVCSKRMLDLMNEEKLNQLEETIEPVENLEENREKEDISEENNEKIEEIQEEISTEIRAKEEEKEDVSEEKVEETEEGSDVKEEESTEEPEEKEEVVNKEQKRDIEEINNKKDIRIHMNTKQNFSLLRAIKDIAEGRSLDSVNAAVNKLGQEEMRNSGKEFVGQIQIPYEIRDVVTVNDEGEDLVATDIWDIMEPLRAKNVLVEAGAQVYTGLVNNVQIPLMSKSNVKWKGEVAPAEDGAGEFTHVNLSPKRLTAYIDISKQFLIQTQNLQAEAKLRNDLVKAINAKLEETILGSEAGSDVQPAGIFNGVTPVEISTFKDICDLEAGVEAENVFGEMNYIIDPKAKAALRNMARSADNTRLVMENGEIDGTKAFVTTNIEENNVVYGDFSNIVIGQWGSLDILVDPYTQAINGCVRLVVNMYVDAKLVRPEALAFGEIETV